MTNDAGLPVKTMFDLEKLIRPNILRLNPYRCARDDYDKGILLDANENSWGAVIPDDDELNRYPSPYQLDLRQKIADFRHVDPEQVFVGVGSDEAIDLIIRMFCRPGMDSIITTPPTYGMYKVAANINDTQVIEIPLTSSFQLQPDTILSLTTNQTKILFLCSPNNPTGNDLNRDDVLRLIQYFPGIVVVDEAYIDFSESESLAPLASQYPNLVVLQTMSKSFGLAGIRLGMAISSKLLVSYLMKIKAPYNINKLTSRVALEAFDHLNYMQRTVERIRAERKRVIKELEQIKGIRKIFPSDANFLLFRIDKAFDVYRKIAESGVVVRYRGNEINCENTLRFTIGTPNENNEFIKRLRAILQ